MRFDKRLHYIMALILLGLAILTAALKLGFFFGPDFLISRFFKSVQAGFGITLMQGVSALASFWFLTLLSIILVFWFYRKKEYRSILFFLFTLISGVLLELLIKVMVGRPRPANPFESGFSFPSGHSVAAVLAYGSLAYLLWDKNRGLAYFLLALPLLIGLSRLYLNVHWFSDVIAGYAIGALWLYFAVWIFFYKAK